MANDVLAEALARIEFKLDLLLKAAELLPPMPMHFQGHTCPVCGLPVDHQIDLVKNVVVRRCGCKTGKQPALTPLFPVLDPTQGAKTNGNAAGNDQEQGVPAPNRR